MRGGGEGGLWYVLCLVVLCSVQCSSGCFSGPESEEVERGREGRWRGREGRWGVGREGRWEGGCTFFASLFCSVFIGLMPVPFVTICVPGSKSSDPRCDKQTAHSSTHSAHKQRHTRHNHTRLNLMHNGTENEKWTMSEKMKI